MIKPEACQLLARFRPRDKKAASRWSAALQIAARWLTSAHAPLRRPSGFNASLSPLPCSCPGCASGIEATLGTRPDLHSRVRHRHDQFSHRPRQNQRPEAQAASNHQHLGAKNSPRPDRGQGDDRIAARRNELRGQKLCVRLQEPRFLRSSASANPRRCSG